MSSQNTGLKKMTVRVNGSSASGIFDAQNSAHRKEVKELLEVIEVQMLGGTDYHDISVKVSPDPITTPQDLFLQAVQKAERKEAMEERRMEARKYNTSRNEPEEF